MIPIPRNSSVFCNERNIANGNYWAQYRTSNKLICKQLFLQQLLKMSKFVPQNYT